MKIPAVTRQPLQYLCRLCGVVFAPKGCWYCPSCKEQRRREYNDRKRVYSRERARRLADAPPIWRCEFDPDGDFTGKPFTSVEVECMLQLHSLSPGAVLVSRRGKRVVVEANNSEQQGASL